MKKLSFYCLAGALLPILYLNPLFMKNETSAAKAPFCEATVLTAESAAPQEKVSDLNPVYVELEETEGWILDEVLSDYISEDVVELQEQGISFTIGEWTERDTHTCLFLNKELPDGTLYSVLGYTKTADGGYVYFEFSSPEPITEQQVVMEITKTFGNTGSSVQKAC